MRKPWMKDLQAFRFTRDGCMTQETREMHYEANRRQYTPKGVVEYADAMGIEPSDAMRRVCNQERLTRV